MTLPGWHTVTIGDLAEGIFDGPHATPKKTATGPVFLGIASLEGGRLNLTDTAHLSEGDFVKWTRRITPQEDDLVFSYETRLGEAALIPKGLRCCLGRRMGLIRPDRSKVHPRFLLYAWLGPEFQSTISARTVQGSTVDRILLTELRSFPLAIPPLPEQRAIAHILGTLDDKIELNRQLNHTLEAIARAIFKSWFVDFDPVWANMEGRPYPLDPATLALFPASFEDSELGEIPAGWKVASLPEAFEINPTRSLSKGQVAPYLPMSDMPTDSALPQSWSEREFGGGVKFTNDDVLVARITPCLENGKTAFVNFLDEGQVASGSTEYLVFRSREMLPAEFAYFFARTDAFRAYAIANMTGTSGRQRVSASAFTHYPVVLPPQELAHQFGNVAKNVFAMMKHNDAEAKTLTALRDTLLPRLISGERRVPAAAALVEEVAS